MSESGLAARIDALLPQTQCTRCGFPTCRAYAAAIASNAADIDRCAPGGNEGVATLAQVLGRAAKALDPDFGIEAPPVVAFIDEDICIGCTKCINACPVDAIVGAAKRMHTIIAVECTGCGLCLPPCPVDCISLPPIATAPLPRAQVIARADRARGRFEARSVRLQHLAGAASAAMGNLPATPSPPNTGHPALESPVCTSVSSRSPARGSAARNPGSPLQGEGSESIAAEAAPSRRDDHNGRTITRAAVLEAIARGKARRAGKPSPR